MVVVSLLLLLCTLVSCNTQGAKFAKDDMDFTSIDFFQGEDAATRSSKMEPACVKLTCFMIAKGAAAVAWPFHTKGLSAANQQVANRKLLEEYQGEQVCICMDDPDAAPADSTTHQALLTPAGEYLYAPDGEPLYAPMGEYMRAPVGEYMRAPMGEYMQAPMSEKASEKEVFRAPLTENVRSSDPIAEFKK